MADPADRARLLELLARTDAVIAGAAAGSDDPEMREAVALAYFGRAWAFGELRRYRESVDACDGFLTRWSELYPAPAGRPRRRLVAVLGFKRDGLRFVGRREDSLLLGAEITERFAEDSDAEIRTLVGLGLVRRAETLLGMPGGIAEALVVSEELVARFGDEPAENLESSGELLLAHAHNLLALYSSAPVLIAGLGAETVINAGAVAAQSMMTAINSAVAWPRGGKLMTRLSRLTPRSMVRHRRRIAQAIVVAEAVRQRFDDYDEPELRALEAKARILVASATAVLGHPLAGGRSMNAFEATGDSGAVQAFSDLATADARHANVLNQISAVAFLRMRAMALVGEDPRLARIAFDDSVTDRLGPELSRVVKLFIKLMRPSAPRRHVDTLDSDDAD